MAYINTYKIWQFRSGVVAEARGTKYDDILDFENVMNNSNVSKLSLWGDDGNDYIIGSRVFQILNLYGLSGDDIILGGESRELNISGGDGNDVIYGGDTAVVSTKQTLSGNAGDDIIHVRPEFRVSYVYGGTGNDLIYTGPMSPTIYGDEGDDIFMIQTELGEASISGGSGIDSLNFIRASETGESIYLNMSVLNSLVTPSVADGVTRYNRTIFLDLIENAQTYDGDDILFGNHLDNRLQAGNGNDKLYGKAGNDILHAGAGTDLLRGGLGHDKLYGDAQDIADYSDSLSNIVIDLSKNGSSAVLIGTSIDSTAYGDEIYGIGNLYAGAGDDYILGNANDNIIHLGDGNDESFGLAGNDTILGEAGNDTIYGNDGDDILAGGLGNDRLLGGNGVDNIHLGNGLDNVWGGNGFDIFTIEASENSIAQTDIIRDFNSYQDMIDLSDLGISASSVHIGLSRTAGVSGFNIFAHGVFSVDVMTGGTGDLTMANIII